MNKNKFRVWDFHAKKYQQLDMGNSCQQFIGILDKNLKEIFERDVVKFNSSKGQTVGVINYLEQDAAFVIDTSTNTFPITEVSLDSLEIVGNLNENFLYNDSGELIPMPN